MSAEFKHLSLQDRESLVAHLRELLAGLERGELTLSRGKQKVQLKPEGLIELEVAARSKGGKRRLTIELEWRDRGHRDRYHKRPLVIE